MLFDTHCHLTHAPLAQQLPQLWAEAAAASVTQFLVPGTAPDDWDGIVQLAHQHAAVYPALGLHPWYAHTHDLATTTDTLAALLQAHSAMWVGEIGLDFVRAKSQTARQCQITAFETQLDLAQQYGRAVVIHNVHAGSACLHSIKRCGFRMGGFAHAFSGSLEEARQWLRCGFKIGIGSLLLKPHSHKVHHVAAALAVHDVVLETDAPYMSPNPPAANHPRNTRAVAEALAALHHTTWQHIANVTTRTAQHSLFIS